MISRLAADLGKNQGTWAAQVTVLVARDARYDCDVTMQFSGVLRAHNGWWEVSGIPLVTVDGKNANPEVVSCDRVFRYEPRSAA